MFDNRRRGETHAPSEEALPGLMINPSQDDVLESLTNSHETIRHAQQHITPPVSYQVRLFGVWVHLHPGLPHQRTGAEQSQEAT